MNSSVNKALARAVSFDRDHMWVELVDGRKLAVPLAFFPRLFSATPDEREQVVISGGGVGLHWDKLDEDISVKGLLLGNSDQTLPSSEAA